MIVGHSYSDALQKLTNPGVADLFPLATWFSPGRIVSKKQTAPDRYQESLPDFLRHTPAS
jgi:hypothetical protein